MILVSENFWNQAYWHCTMYSFYAGYARQGIWRIYQNLVMKSLISSCRVEHQLTNSMTLFASRFVCTGIFLLSFLWQLGWLLKLPIKKEEVVFQPQYVFLEILIRLGDVSTQSAERILQASFSGTFLAWSLRTNNYYHDYEFFYINRPYQYYITAIFKCDPVK